MANQYKRMLLKLSGEALMGQLQHGIDKPTLTNIAEQLRTVQQSGIELCVVVGAGNIYRGIEGQSQGIDPATSDYMGMLATIMNALALQSALENLNLEARVLSAIPMQQLCEPYIHRRALRHLERNRIVIFAAGTGNPFFTTDTAATLRASEMKCDILMKGTKVDGVYTSDPSKDANAKRMDTISYNDVLAQHLKFMDATAIALAREKQIPIVVFSILEQDGFVNAARGKGKSTLISSA